MTAVHSSATFQETKGVKKCLSVQFIQISFPNDNVEIQQHREIFSLISHHRIKGTFSDIAGPCTNTAHLSPRVDK